MSRTKVVYLLHFIDRSSGLSARYGHAGHYVGWTYLKQLDERLDDHRGRGGSKLTNAAYCAGLDFIVTRLWYGGRWEERQLKGAARGSATSWVGQCPWCKAERAGQLWGGLPRKKDKVPEAILVRRLRPRPKKGKVDESDQVLPLQQEVEPFLSIS